MPAPSHGGDDDVGCLAKAFVLFLRVIKLLAIVALLGDIVAYCLSMKGAIESKSTGNYSKAFFVLSSAGFCIIALFQILAEFEPNWFLIRVRIMKYWMVRGFLIGWQGIQTISSSESIGEVVTDVSRDEFRMAGDVVGWTLIGIGACYILMSCLCMKKWVGLKKPEDINVRLIPEERMDNFGRSIGIESSDSKEYALREAHVVISNMAIAMDLTSSKAWSIFSGNEGAEEARRIRTERFAASLLSEKTPIRDHYAPPNAPVVGVPVESCAAVHVEDRDENPRARRAREQDADLEAAYYQSH